MDVIIMNNYDDVCREAARVIVEACRKKNDLVLGLATGSTSLGVYARLIEASKKGEVDFSGVRTFNLDEYLGLPEDHPHSYAYFMDQNFFRHVTIKRSNIHRLQGKPLDIERHCREYEDLIREAGGIEIQLLGIGRNGHIGFNEPGSSLSSRTRAQTLTRETVTDNARFFSKDETVPAFVLTMGVGTIMDARTILLLAYGANKSEAILRCVEGPVTASLPASALQLHPQTTLISDEDAARHLTQKDFYKWVYQNKDRMTDYLK
jgi:glucosamine-6-phosphate deaminase